MDLLVGVPSLSTSPRLLRANDRESLLDELNSEELLREKQEFVRCQEEGV